MARKILCFILLIFFLHQTQCQSPPKITGSYKAWGEVTQGIQDMPARVQLAFEESYDADTGNAAFVIWMAGKNVSFVKNNSTGQTFRYAEGKECDLTTETEWIDSDYPPGLLKYEHDDGTVRFSLKQLFNIPEQFLTEKNVSKIYRDIPARLWLYEIPSKDKNDKSKLSVYSYWTEYNWSGSSNEPISPLGFTVEHFGKDKEGKMKVTTTVTSIFGLASGTYDRKHFEPVQGVTCINRKKTIPFPNLQNIKALSIHSEMVLPDYQEIRYIDTWFNPSGQLIRIDIDRLKDEEPDRKVKRYVSDTAIGQMGIVFRKGVYKDEFTCEVIPFANYENDLQNFIDIKQELSKWKPGRLFGLNDTEYVYIGTTTKFDIPCHLFQGIRKDWPEKSSNIESLWEWCFNVNMTGPDKAIFRDDEIGLLSAQVTITKSANPAYPVNFRMFHHFYEVSASNPDFMYATHFDISPCFSVAQRRFLQFSLDWDIKDDDMLLAENMTSDVGFLQLWRAAIYRNSGLQPYSLRISNLLGTIEDKTFYIKFAILQRHPDLPKNIIDKELKAFDAESKLRDKIKDGALFINYPFKKEQKKLTAQSLTFQMNPDFKPHTLPTLPSTIPTSSTKFPFSLITESTRQRTTATDEHGSILTEEPGITSTKPTEKKRVIKTGHQPGSVAAVSISMLLVGVTVGCAGTFYKFNGLPSCLKR